MENTSSEKIEKLKAAIKMSIWDHIPVIGFFTYIKKLNRADKIVFENKDDPLLKEVNKSFF